MVCDPKAPEAMEWHQEEVAEGQDQLSQDTALCVETDSILLSRSYSVGPAS